MASFVHWASRRRDSDGILVQDVDASPNERRDLPSARAASVRTASASDDMHGPLMTRHELQALKRPRNQWGRAVHPHPGACAPLRARTQAVAAGLDLGPAWGPSQGPYCPRMSLSGQPTRLVAKPHGQPRVTRALGRQDNFSRGLREYAAVEFADAPGYNAL